MAQVTCPHCDAKQETEAKTGELIRCEVCNKPFEVPQQAVTARSRLTDEQREAMKQQARIRARAEAQSAPVQPPSPLQTYQDHHASESFWSRNRKTIITALVCLGVGWFIGREHLKYELRSKLASAFSELGEKLEEKSSSPKVQEEPQVKGWQYRVTRDEMRGTTREMGSLLSENYISMDFPYKDSYGIVATDKDFSYVMLGITSGQIKCNGGPEYETCHISAKFNDGKIGRYLAKEIGDENKTLAIVGVDAATFVKNLKAAKTFIIEMDLYKHPNAQFTFENIGLER